MRVFSFLVFVVSNTNPITVNVISKLKSYEDGINIFLSKERENCYGFAVCAARWHTKTTTTLVVFIVIV